MISTFGCLRVLRRNRGPDRNRRKIYATIEQLQADLDVWLAQYNELRPHQGRWCYGKTPRQTFVDAIPLAREKILSPAVAAGAGTGVVTLSEARPAALRTI